MLGLIPRWPIVGVAIPKSQLLCLYEIPGVEATLGMCLIKIITYAAIKNEFIRGNGLLPQLACELYTSTIV